jgi:hypothetical protein
MPPYTDADLIADVAQHQWVVLKMTPGKATEYGYSVGLQKSFGHAELVAVGLDDDTMQELINDIGEAIEGGTVFHDGDVSSDFLDGYDVTFRAVPAELHAAHFAWAERFYPDTRYSVLQIVYPDRDRRWPWNAGVSADFRKGQTVLSDLHRKSGAND